MLGGIGGGAAGFSGSALGTAEAAAGAAETALAGVEATGSGAALASVEGSALFGPALDTACEAAPEEGCGGDAHAAYKHISVPSTQAGRKRITTIKIARIGRTLRQVRGKPQSLGEGSPHSAGPALPHSRDAGTKAVLDSFSMSFRLFNVDVEIQFGFWIMAFLLGYASFGRGGIDPGLMGVWIAVVLLSILVHEYGHAFAVKRHAIEPNIALHWMGGTTFYRTLLPLRRLDRVIISAAGPFAGFALAGIVYCLRVLAEDWVRTWPFLGRVALQQIQQVNIYWGIINLIPVLPFDGGHVLEHTLGPKRARITAIISLVAGTAVALYFLKLGSMWGAFIFGMGAVQSFQRFRSEGSRSADGPAPQVSPEATAALKSARQALADEQLDRAIALAERVLSGEAGTPSPRATALAYEIIAWAHQMAGRLDEAENALARAGMLGPVDAALAATLVRARGKTEDARKLLESAYASGDQRKEIVGPLIQILLEQNDIQRAADIAVEIVDTLSEDDIRQMAGLTFKAHHFDGAAKLWEAAFERKRSAEDAYDAARAWASGGHRDRALESLRKAVSAGFSDRKRAWSDAALALLHEDAKHLEAVVGPP